MPKQAVETVTLNPKYIPLVQRPCCCCVTCLQMILYRRGFGLFDQEGLAKYFGVIVDKEDLGAFNVKLNARTESDEFAGIKTVESEKMINQFFKEKNIPLTAKAVRASEITDLEEFLTGNLRKNNDLWIEYKMHEIYKDKRGHDGLIESITKTKECSKVVLIDPLWSHKPRLDVEVEKIRAAISNKYGRETGFVVISNK